MANASSDKELYEQIRREHEELRELLGNIHQCLGKRLESVAEVAGMLDALSDHVRQHFSEEETDGLFDQIVAEAPRLSHCTDVLRGEHVKLLEAVRQLNECANGGDGSADWWQRLEATFHDFSKQLMHHESKESELLMDAYDQDIGSQD